MCAEKCVQQKTEGYPEFAEKVKRIDILIGELK